MLPGRFFLGVGTGENLNEHVLGQRWPSPQFRREMLEEAVDVIRTLWQGELTSHHGKHYTVENARIYTLPEEPTTSWSQQAGPAAELAARIGDGLIGTAPDTSSSRRSTTAGGSGKPRYGQLTVCWAENEADARRTAYEWWPTAALKGPLAQELPLPSHFEAAAEMVTEDEVAEMVVCGPDPEAHLAGSTFAEAGYNHVYVHQVGPDQEGFRLLCAWGHSTVRGARRFTVGSRDNRAHPTGHRARNEQSRYLARDAAPGGRVLPPLRPLAEPPRQTVFGEGRERAAAMLVGERPGDIEDTDGRPFIGPAGRLLRAALEEAGLDESGLYLTNAVKHFKWRPRGTRRIHEKPSWSEVRACDHWLRLELAVVRPRLVVCLGATAAQALLGRSARVNALRGKVIGVTDFGVPAVVTIPPVCSPPRR